MLSASFVQNVVDVGAFSVFGLVLALAGFDWLRRQPRAWGEIAQNLISATVNQVVLLSLVLGLSLAGFTALRELSPLPAWDLSVGSWVLGFVLVDFIYYWNHRFEHRISLLWGHHSVHHSSTAFDLSTALRVAWHDGITAVAVYGILAFVGLHPAMIAALIQVNLVLQVWIHTTTIRRVPLLEGIINTPAAHRVHHASNPHAIDKNHGGFLMIWDRIFGTYADERDVEAADGALRFGLTTGPVGANPLRVTTAHYAAIVALLRRSRSVSDVVLAVVGPPEWTPEHGFAATAATSTWQRLAGLVRR